MTRPSTRNDEFTPGDQHSTPAASLAPDRSHLPTVDELRLQVERLERDKAELQALTATYREQLARGTLHQPVTTGATTKPTLKFSVSGPEGESTFDVVDESEAKRLYCLRHKLEPSLCVLKVECLERDIRRTRIVQQYEQAGVAIDRVPGVQLGV